MDSVARQVPATHHSSIVDEGSSGPCWRTIEEITQYHTIPVIQWRQVGPNAEHKCEDASSHAGPTPPYYLIIPAIHREKGLRAIFQLHLLHNLHLHSDWGQTKVGKRCSANFKTSLPSPNANTCRFHEFL